MQLSIIIPTKDRPAILEKTIDRAIQAIGHLQAEIIVVNDSKTSQPDTSKFAAYGLQVINNLKSGVASARNFGASKAKGDWLLFLDDDIWISRDSIDQTLAQHAVYTRACFNPDWVYPQELHSMLAERSFGRFLIRYNLVSFKGWYAHDRWKDHAIFESPMVASFHLSISRSDFLESGGYDEIFPHAGFEDYDFPVRLRKMGMKLLINTQNSVYHNEADRQDLKSWLQRQIRGGHTRRIGVEIGYGELSIHYGPLKKMILHGLSMMKTALIAWTEKIPNAKAFDFIYFRFVLTLQAICIFEGYRKS